MTAPYIAVHERLILAVKALAQAALKDNPDLFPDITDAMLWDQITENFDPVALPVVLITIEGLSATYKAIDEFSDEVYRPVGVVIADRNDPHYTPHRGKYLLWDESLTRAFRWPVIKNGIQAAVPECSGCWMEPKPVFDARGASLFRWQHGMTLKFRCIEPRGVASQMTE
jgi:hypothetical protein